jgi:hypothetical protein
MLLVPNRKRFQKLKYLKNLDSARTLVTFKGENQKVTGPARCEIVRTK